MNGDRLNYDFSRAEERDAFIVGSLRLLEERTKCLEDLKPLIPRVDKMEVEITGIKEDVKDAKFWGNFKTALGPVLVLLHVTAHKLGIPI
jgi:hypothetical protein